MRHFEATDYQGNRFILSINAGRIRLAHAATGMPQSLTVATDQVMDFQIQVEQACDASNSYSDTTARLLQITKHCCAKLKEWKQWQPLRGYAPRA